MALKKYPTTIIDQELSFIEKQLLNEKKQLKAPALKALPDHLKQELISRAASAGLQNTSNLSECVFWIVNQLSDYPKRCSCGKPITKFHSFSRGYPHNRCSTSCSNSDPSVQEKKKQASREKYGTDFPWQNQDIKQRARETFVKGWFEKRFTQFLPEYEPLTKEVDYSGSKVKFTWKHKCGHVFEEMMTWRDRKPMCPACRKHSHISRPQRDITEFVKSLYSGIIISNDRRVIKPLELDIYIPEKQLAVEYHGFYWHTEGDRKKDIEEKIRENKSLQYKHKEKADICEQNGIKLIQIFQDEWFNKQDIVKARLRSALGVDSRIFARKCEIKEVNSKDSTVFLDRIHIQGKLGAKVRLGLYQDDKLVALMTFGVPRYDKKKRYEWELLRYCSDGTVIGGASKLFKHFIKIYSPSNIISYADRRWSTGKMYEQLGFCKVNYNQVGFSYIKGNNRYRREAFQKHKLSKILENFDSQKSEVQNMFANGYERIWDAGSLTMIWKSNAD